MNASAAHDRASESVYFVALSAPERNDEGAASFAAGSGWSGRHSAGEKPTGGSMTKIELLNPIPRADVPAEVDRVR